MLKLTTWRYAFLSIGLLQGVFSTTMTAFKRELSVIPVRSALNRDTRYGPWPNPTQILYFLDPSYTATEQASIQQAMAQVSADMNGCIRFQQRTSANAGTDFVYISKTLNTGSAVPTCFSFPGRVVTQAGQGQKMALFGTTATNGCLDSVRDIMKYIVHVLGLRNEFNRPDRDTYITVFPNNVKSALQSLNIFKSYTPTQVDYLNTAFDFDSVTIPAPTKYANPGTVVYSAIPAGESFGTLARLSQGDCVGIALQYTGCNLATCQDPYNTGSATVPTGAPVSGATVTGVPIQGQSTVGPLQPGQVITGVTVVPGPTTIGPVQPS